MEQQAFEADDEPPVAQTGANSLKKHISKNSNLKTINDVHNWAKDKPEAVGIFETNYEASLFEQELCLRSAKFLGSPLSSWSQTVMLDRASLNNWNRIGEKDESILSVLAPELDNVPGLIWLFPEGSTKRDKDNKKDDTFGIKVNFKV